MVPCLVTLIDYTRRAGLLAPVELLVNVLMTVLGWVWFRYGSAFSFGRDWWTDRQTKRQLL